MARVAEEAKVIISAAVAYEQRAELERRAAEADRSLSGEIRRALTRYLEDDEEEETT